MKRKQTGQLDMKTTLKFMNLLGFLVMIAANLLDNALPINGYTTGEISDLYSNLFVPAGFTFSIWGLIYLLLSVFIIFQFSRAGWRKQGIISGFGWRIGGFFPITCLANASWIVAWHYRLVWLSVIIMLVLLASLIVIYIRLNIGFRTGSLREKFLVHLPFSIYLGWISVATVANVTALLVAMNWDRFGMTELFWVSTILLVVYGISLLMLIFRRDIAFNLVILWTYIGIFAKRFTDHDDPSQVLFSVLIAVILLTFLGIILKAREWFKYQV